MRTLIFLFIVTLFNSSLSSDFEGYVKYSEKVRHNEVLEMIEYIGKDITAINVKSKGFDMKFIYDNKNKKKLQ